MEFFKYFDWPRKINVEPQTVQQGNVGILNIIPQTLPAMASQWLNMGSVVVKSSGRPISVSFQPAFAAGSNGGCFFPNGLSGNQNILLGVAVQRNGTTVQEIMFRHGILNFVPPSVVSIPLSLANFIDFNPPSGNLTYNLQFYVTAARTTDVGSTNMMVREL
jgi:hypothetical protein